MDALTIRRSLPHGHVVAVLGTVRTLGLDRLLGPAGNRCRDLVLAMVVARLLAPASKLATALSEATLSHSLGAVPGLGEVDGSSHLPRPAPGWRVAQRRDPVERPLLQQRAFDLLGVTITP